MEGLLNQMRRAAQEAVQDRATVRHGTISSYDPSNYAVKVELQPDGTLTGWIPLKSICAGNGWGIFCPPAIGTAVEISFQEADGGVGSAGLSFFNDVERPLSVPASEFWLVHKSGVSIKLTNDGTATIDTGAGASIQLNGSNITSSGNWTHTGSITASDDVVASGIRLKGHHHTGVQTGSGNTGGPA